MERSPSWWRTQPFNAGSRFWRWTTQFGAMSSTTTSTAPRTRSAPSRPRRWHAATAHHRPVFNAGKARNEGRQLLLRFEVGHPRVDEIRCHGAGAAGITVNALIPGLVDTPLTRYPKRFSESIGETRPNPPADPSPQEAWNVRAPTVPPRIGWPQPEDISPAAVFLASDAAAMVTGAEYEVTGGDSAKDA
jgi:NAD(P)-dependent dehydrogenase (short-subunit alcohol dehydrogenase family)